MGKLNPDSIASKDPLVERIAQEIEQGAGLQWRAVFFVARPFTTVMLWNEDVANQMVVRTVKLNPPDVWDEEVGMKIVLRRAISRYLKSDTSSLRAPAELERLWGLTAPKGWVMFPIHATRTGG